MIEQRLEFGGRNLTSLVQVFSVTRPVSPERRYDKTEVPGRDGVLVSSDSYEPYEVDVSVMLRADTALSVEEARRQLSSALNGCVQGLLVLPGSEGVAYEAMFTGGAELKRIEQYPTAKLTFLVTDPVGRGRTRKLSVAAGSSAIANVLGTAKTWPVVTATPAGGSSWTLTDVAGGKRVRVDSTFTGAQKVVLDMGRVNGADHPVSLDSDFFPLEPGRHVVSVSSGKAEVEWQERWL